MDAGTGNMASTSPTDLTLASANVDILVKSGP